MLVVLSPGIDPAQHKFTIFAVFDGHGGKEVAKFCKDHFIPELIQTDQFRNANYVQALRETFHRMDEMVDDEVVDNTLDNSVDIISVYTLSGKRLEASGV